MDYNPEKKAWWYIMGHTETINVIGLDNHGDSYYAMNKVEMAIANERAKMVNRQMVWWFAQTKKGMKMLGSDYMGEKIPDNKIKHTKFYPCNVCFGIGHVKKPGDLFPFLSCAVCVGIGKTTKTMWKKFPDWTVKEINRKFYDYDPEYATKYMYLAERAEI